MNASTKHIIIKAKLKWGAIILVESMLLTWVIGFIFLIVLLQFDVNTSLQLIIIVFAIIGSVLGGVIYISKVTAKNVLRLINRQFNNVEESAHLLLKKERELTLVGKLQRTKAEMLLANSEIKLHHSHRIVPYAVLLFVVVILYITYPHFAKEGEPQQNTASVTTNSISVNNEKVEPVVVNSVELQIWPPSYTKLEKRTQKKWDVKAIENSYVRWKIQFSGAVKEVHIRLSNGEYVNFKENKDSYVANLRLISQGYYELLFKDTLGTHYSSEFYKIEVVNDNAPSIKIVGIPQYAEFNYEETKSANFSAHLTDDFGLKESRIIATITKGSGESVKFREEKLSFENKLILHSINQILSKTINFTQMGMEPGDELYFYVEASDNRHPKSNLSRSETYFIVLRDTVTYEFTVDDDFGVDLMPEYFRSQRQLIIDTEKLIAAKSKLSKHDFNNTSNELGFDQKVLRLKYGQFMGEEDDSGIALQEDVEELEEGQHEEESKENQLKGYTHNHDSENEHNLVDNGNHDINEEGEVEEDPLEAYQHMHDTEDVATFLTNTIKGKLRAAMNLMWDAELYLRLFQPETSLPYQYKALKLIKEIKNHARIYVHRIGFDPPPIKEESRLTGDLDQVSSRRRENRIEIDDSFLNVEKVIVILNTEMDEIDSEKLILFTEAGKEIALFAIENPGRYLSALQWLKQLSEGRLIYENQQHQLRKDLISILPDEVSSPSQQRQVVTKLQELYYQQLLEGRSEQ